MSVQALHLSLSTHWLNILYYCIYPPLDLFKWDIYDGYGIMFTAFIIVIFRWNHPHVFPKACEEQRSISHNRWIFHYTIHEVRSCSLWYTVHQCRAAFLRISFHTFAVSLNCWIGNKHKNRTEPNPIYPSYFIQQYKFCSSEYNQYKIHMTKYILNRTERH